MAHFKMYCSNIYNITFKFVNFYHNKTFIAWMNDEQY